MTPDTQWTVGKCHRVIRPLHSALAKLNDLKRMYPSLLEYPYPDKDKENFAILTSYNTHNHARPTRLASQKFTYSSRKGNTTSGVFGPVFVTSFAGEATSVENKKKKEENCNKSPKEIFDEFKSKSSVEFYSCVLALFRAFRQFLLMIGNRHSVHSLLERSAFEVGRCIAMTEDNIPEEVWYENTEMFARYRRVITMGHGIELIMNHAESLRHTLPAFIMECAGNDNIYLASILAEKYISVLPNDEFWLNLRQMESISELTDLKGSFTLSSILYQIGDRFKMSEIKAKGLSCFLEYLRSIKQRFYFDEDKREALRSTGIRCIQIMIRGERRLRKNPIEVQFCESLMLQFMQLLVNIATDDILDNLISLASKRRKGEMLQCLKVFKAYKSETEIESVPFLSPQLLKTFTTLFPDFSLFRKVMDRLWDSHPKFVCKVAAHFIAAGGKGLAAVEWQDALENATKKLPGGAEQALDSWVLCDGEEAMEANSQTSEEEDYDENGDDEIVAYLPHVQAAPQTPRSDLQSKYNKILPNGILEWSLRKSASKRGNLSNTPRTRTLKLHPTSDIEESPTIHSHHELADVDSSPLVSRIRTKRDESQNVTPYHNTPLKARVGQRKKTRNAETNDILLTKQDHVYRSPRKGHSNPKRQRRGWRSCRNNDVSYVDDDPVVSPQRKMDDVSGLESSPPSIYTNYSCHAHPNNYFENADVFELSDDDCESDINSKGLVGLAPSLPSSGYNRRSRRARRDVNKQSVPILSQSEPVDVSTDEDSAWESRSADTPAAPPSLYKSLDEDFRTEETDDEHDVSTSLFAFMSDDDLVPRSLSPPPHQFPISKRRRTPAFLKTDAAHEPQPVAVTRKRRRLSRGVSQVPAHCVDVSDDEDDISLII